ncbi:hypothetical protein [Thalassospira povalilytica]|uniref:Uncharacterized protein n=1 Tax=Thalassospira povalilytica TaxID=732237 RepID=A0A8I1MBH8_9PROT|nr:hypothetical protein [Thalassospira povalilytica]MBN8198599.1 hypothetical protein [Thalassospira povalilytica]
MRAELRKSGVPLSAGRFPAQINIPDGGEDGRVEWRGLPNTTDYLPSKYTVFQCKKSDPGPSELKKEVWTKASAKGTQSREINEALGQALAEGGGYVVVTSDPVVGTKLDRRINAIKDGIREAGADPDDLAKIDIYDANILAAWVCECPAVALWLNESLSEADLRGFRNFDDWSSDHDISNVQFRCKGDARYRIHEQTFRRLELDEDNLSQCNDFDETVRLLAKFVGGSYRGLRIVGASGYGKTRFLNELYRTEGQRSSDEFDQANLIYTAYDDVKDNILSVVRQIARSGAFVDIVVDDCPDDVHTNLLKATQREHSNCRVITLGVDTATAALEGNFVLELTAASDELIDELVESVVGIRTHSEKSILRDLADGFPRMAILAAREIVSSNFLEMPSVDALLNRIIWGTDPKNASALETLKILSLFSVVGVENDASHEIAELTSILGRSKGEVYADIAYFKGRGLVSRIGDYVEVQPLPLAMRLGSNWIEVNLSGALMALFERLSSAMQLKMIKRLRWLSWVEEVGDFASALLQYVLPSREVLNTEIGAETLDRLVHLNPDRVMVHLDSLFYGMSHNDLLSFREGRRHVVWALEKLVFRNSTFERAARLLLRFAAAENENFSNNSTGQFVSLFQLYLSGTEAAPAAKLRVVDEALSSENLAVRQVVVKALNQMLKVHHFTRTGGNEQIGVGAPLRDWQPLTTDDVLDYYRSALERLSNLACDDPADPLAVDARDVIGSNLRGLFRFKGLFSFVVGVIHRLKTCWPDWFRPVQAVNDWLFFDSEGAPESYKASLKQLYLDLLPSEPIQVILLFSSGWTTDFYDPDTTYDVDGTQDYRYAETKIVQTVDMLPRDASCFNVLLEKLQGGGFVAAGFSVYCIAKHVTNPITLIEIIISRLRQVGETALSADLVRNIIAGASDVDKDTGRACLNFALDCPEFHSNLLEFLTVVQIDEPLFDKLYSAVKDGDVDVWRLEAIAYPQKLSSIPVRKIVDFVRLLASRDPDSAWASVSFLSRYLHRRGDLLDEFSDQVKVAVTNPLLFEKERLGQMDSYQWRMLIEHLLDSGCFSDEFVCDLTNYILSLLDVQSFSVQLSLERDAQGVLVRLIESEPAKVWECYVNKIEGEDSHVAFRVASLLGPEDDFSGKEGVLCCLPEGVYLPWLSENPTQRLAIVLGWVRMFDSTEGNQTWNYKFVGLLEKYVTEFSQLDVISSRFDTGGWVGSYSVKLEKQVRRLKELDGLVSNPIVKSWVAICCENLNGNIKAEKRADENREAHYRE